MAEGQAPLTPVELIRLTAEYFAKKGIDSPRLTAEVLLASVLSVTRLDLYLQYDKPLSSAEVDSFRALVRRRAAGEPTAYLLGKREFWSLDFAVGPGVLIPRPDTETLVESCLSIMGGEGRFLEIGVGSGAVSVALLKERPRWTAVGIDTETAPLDCARKNAETHGVADRLDLRRGSLFSPVENETFDLIVSNPPYIPSGDIDSLAAEVSRFEPRKALDGGVDGLDLIREIANKAPTRLKSKGALLLEFGTGQEEAVAGILESVPGLSGMRIISDYAKKPRVAAAIKI
ncbi:peptide chain release factor N(5)-glutamine methyltransferase [bacterium]|nr:MAG: peptide chain release factor N(5)-glutamine methyltransferase [bacterium]